MGTKLFVGNLSYGTTSADLENHFRQIGETTSAQVITDRESGRSRGFGFVAMDEVAALRWIKHYAQRDEHDLLIDDCAPTGETLQLLPFPDAAT